MAVLLPHDPKRWDYRCEPSAQLLYLPLFVLRFIYIYVHVSAWVICTKCVQVPMEARGCQIS